ncbi:hypothetical protein A0U40_17655 [[Bacillus] sp. KCTC 13219]|nr:hypothetical protein A0U40_17655 [[Bacillus] sp. KCTC 13219]
MFDNVIQYYYLAPIFLTLFVAVTYSINHWDMPDIEKNFITRFKRIQITVSLMLIETLSLEIYFAVVINKGLLKSFPDVKDLYQKVFLISVTLFLVSAFFILMINISFQILKQMIAPKVRYYVILEGSNDKWLLERATFHKQILLRNDEGDYILLKEWDNLKFKNNELIFPKLGSWIYKTNKRFNLIMMWLVVSMGSLIIWAFLLDKGNPNHTWISNTLIVTVLIILTAFVALLNTKKLYRKGEETMLKTRKYLVPSSMAAKVTYGKTNSKKKICIHETGNKSKGSCADNHARLQANGNNRQASWHWTVDDKEAVQSFEHDYACWAAGTTTGNKEAIQIEMCVNSDGNYARTVENTAMLVAQILKEEKLAAKDIVQHHYYSKKNCPEIMRSGKIITWQQFLRKVEGYLQQQSTEERGEADMELLTSTGRAEIRALLKKARDKNIINKVTHTDVAIEKYSDVQLLSYQAAVVNRTIS